MAHLSQSTVQYQLDHIDQNQRASIITSHVICLILACVAVSLRFVAHRITRATLKADDYMIVAALVTTINIPNEVKRANATETSGIRNR